jgi:hypothetical protein
MKYLAMVIVFLLGLLVSQVPDLICIYHDHIIHKYQKSECYDKGLGPNQCHFGMYFYKFREENPRLDSIGGYFLLGEGPLYFVLTRRCTEEIFYNPSATSSSGKITLREYFRSRCSSFMNQISDLLYGKE